MCLSSTLTFDTVCILLLVHIFHDTYFSNIWTVNARVSIYKPIHRWQGTDIVSRKTVSLLYINLQCRRVLPNCEGLRWIKPVTLSGIV